MAVDEQIRATASAFVHARQHASVVATYPGPPPVDLATAYAIQEEALRLHARPIGGWKVGRIWPPLDQQYGTNRLAGPIFADSIGNGSNPVGRVFADGFSAAEAEFLFRLRDDIPTGGITTDIGDVANLIADIHVGIEIASSPFPGINELGPAVTVSDFGNNNGLIVGAAIPDWRTSGFADWPVRLLIDDIEAGTGMASAFPDGPLGALHFLIAHLAARNIPATPGMWVSSGAVTGVHVVRPGQKVTAVFGEDFVTACTISPASPQ